MSAMQNTAVVQPNRRKSLKQWLRSMRGQQILVTLVFLFVPLLLLVTFTYLPFFKMVQFSFFSMRYIGRRTFVGLQNYIDVFTRDDIFHALTLSLYYMAGSVIQMALALLFATLLSFKTKGSKFFRGALYFPCLICGISVGFIFKFFFTHGFVLDTLLSWVGFNVETLPYWLRDESINNIVLVACSLWKYTSRPSSPAPSSRAWAPTTNTTWPTSTCRIRPATRWCPPRCTCSPGLWAASTTTSAQASSSPSSPP